MGAIADRAQETTNTTGTGTLTLAGAVSKFQAFSAAFSNKQPVEYVILSGTDWEVGQGTYTTSGGTLSRDIIRRSSNSGSAINVAAGAFVWADISADNFTSSVQPFRNRLYNGAWRFDQVNEGSAYIINSTVAVQGPDGWSGDGTASAGVFTMTRVADPDNASLFALKIACTTADASIAAGDLYRVWTTVEGYDAADLKVGTASAAAITISFDMKFDVAGQYGMWIWNSAANRYYVGTVTQNVGSTNESKVVTLVLDTSGTWLYTNGIGLRVGFTLAAGSLFQGTAGVWGSGTLMATSSQCNFMSANTNVGYIKRIQLEKGTIATPFQEFSYQEDLNRTQRYAEKSYSQGAALGTGGAEGLSIGLYSPAPFSAFITNDIVFKAQKRSTPAMSGYAFTAGTLGKWTDTVAGDQNVTFANTSARANSQAALASGTSVAYGHWYANARLS